MSYLRSQCLRVKLCNFNIGIIFVKLCNINILYNFAIIFGEDSLLKGKKGI